MDRPGWTGRDGQAGKANRDLKKPSPRPVQPAAGPSLSHSLRRYRDGRLDILGIVVGQGARNSGHGERR